MEQPNANNISNNKSCTNTENNMNNNTITVNTLNNNSSLKNDITKEDKTTKNKLPIKKIVIISISILIAIVILIVVIVVATRKKDKPKKEINPVEEPEEPEKPVISYEEAEKLIDSEIIRENHILLENSSKNMKELLTKCNNISFSELNVSINDDYKDKDFLKDINESWIEFAKDDMELYNTRFIILKEQINSLFEESSESFKNLSIQLNQVQYELDNLTKNFEETIQILAIPFSLSKNKTIRNLEDSLNDEELLSKYKSETEKLNGYYNIYFKNINDLSSNLLSTTESLHNNEIVLGNELRLYIIDFNLITFKMQQETVHESLKLIKDSFISFQEKANNFIDDLIDKAKNIGNFLGDKITDVTSNIINTLTYINDFNQKINQDIPILDKIPLPIEILDNVIHFVGTSIDSIKGKMQLSSEMSNVEVSTSLDLLLILDLTGSMRYYVQEAKRSLLSIIDGIIEKCPGIDINLGFIGYRDFNDEYIDIDFTQNHLYLKNIISNVYASGGGYYIPEDVALVSK